MVLEKLLLPEIHPLYSILSSNSSVPLYLFILEDRSSNKVKYMAIGQSDCTRLMFFKIRFKYELYVNINIHESTPG